MPSKKIDQDFILSDSTLNSYGLRLVTSGYQMDEFLKNPIGYYGHDKKDGVLLKWEDLRLDGDSIIGKPVINLDHPRAERTVHEIEEGFLNAASVGKIHILDFDFEDNPENADDPIMVITKWYNKECSIVDNPGNRSAMKVDVELFDKDANEINLSDVRQSYIDNKNFKPKQMKKVTLEITPELVLLLTLSGDEPTAEALMTGIKSLHNENAQLTKDMETLTKDTKAKEVKTILDNGLSEGRLTAATRSELETEFSGNPVALKKIVDSMPVYLSLTDKLNTVAPEVKDLADKDYDTLDKANKLELLKAKAPAMYKEKYKAKFGKEPN